MGRTLKELAEFVGGALTGDGSTVIHGVNGLKEAGAGEISFLANPKYAPLLAATRASAVIVATGVPCPIPSIAVANPDLAFGLVAEKLDTTALRFPEGVHPSAVVAPGASIGRGVFVGACAVVEEGAVIGEGTVLYPQVYVGHAARIGPGCTLYPQVVVRERCEVGARVIIHSGTIVGSDGFGYSTEKGVHRKIPQVGIVVLEDDVELGANVTIDRARFGRTVIKKGAKIDNLVQIAHNVVVGDGSLIAAQVGIAGSTKLGKYVILAGKVGIVGHIELGDRCVVTAQSGVGKDVPAGAIVGGHHAVEQRTYLKRVAALAKLPESLVELRKLRQEVEGLKRRLEARSGGP